MKIFQMSLTQKKNNRFDYLIVQVKNNLIKEI
jgi:hypothetical protein